MMTKTTFRKLINTAMRFDNNELTLVKIEKWEVNKIKVVYQDKYDKVHEAYFYYDETRKMIDMALPEKY